MTHMMPTQKYIAVHYAPETEKNLRLWCKKNGFNLTLDYDGNKRPESEWKFHTTVIASESVHIVPANGEVLLPRVQVYPDSMQLLGENSDVLVMLLKNDVIKTLRDRYSAIFDMTDKWPEYKPHVSVTYERKKMTADALASIELPKFPMYLDKLIVEAHKSGV